MKNHLLFTIISLILTILGCVSLSRTYAGNAIMSDKPLLYMTPTDIFTDARLRKLAQAAQKGDVSQIDELISEGVNVNGKGKYGITPLYSAVQAGNKIGYRALLDRGANPNVVFTNGFTLMNIVSASSTDPDFLKLALKYGGNPNLVAPRMGETPILAAITTAGKVNIPLLIEAGANLNQQTSITKETAIMKAVMDFGHFDVVYRLLKAGADYKLKDAQGNDIRDYIQRSFHDNISPEEQNWRNKVIEYLKSNDYWERISPPENIKTTSRHLAEGESYTLSWDSVSGATTYDLRVNQKLDKTGIVGTSVSKVAPDKKNTVDGHLYWSVRACKGDNCSAWSSIVDVDVK